MIILFSGPPGAGKTTLARSLLDLLQVATLVSVDSLAQNLQISPQPLHSDTTPQIASLQDFKAPQTDLQQLQSQSGNAKVLSEAREMAEKQVLGIIEANPFATVLLDDTNVHLHRWKHWAAACWQHKRKFVILCLTPKSREVCIRRRPSIPKEVIEKDWRSLEESLDKVQGIAWLRRHLAFPKDTFDALKCISLCATQPSRPAVRSRPEKPRLSFVEHMEIESRKRFGLLAKSFLTASPGKFSTVQEVAKRRRGVLEGKIVEGWIIERANLSTEVLKNECGGARDAWNMTLDGKHCILGV